ncbi:hypothetical protein ACFOY4_13040 [Actinomadura syzygii]|uniref:Uncharacterized protein n=1 Tax=Actinomadura syzygii TaxID=1427538 RepID=A0A5D0U7A7_9ACTN|nr:hypothetical protein [Actinomadura syzygii]TYC13854.1 hypothetical protein FXF65_19580 [Actinomadura syzygii]
MNASRHSEGEHNATFNAHDNAKIGGQFAYMYGNVHIYDVGESAPPEERFDKALNLLDGAMPRRAEQLIQEAVEGGYQSHKVAYYWALAVLSGRSFDHLDNPEFESLRHASALVDPNNPDEWVEALNVITRFVNCLLQQERVGMMNEQEYELSLRLHDALPEVRREELRRHLEFIMTGALQDRLEATYAAKIREYRMAGDRENRAKKFFTPIPYPPIPREPTESAITTGARVGAALGAVIAGMSLLTAFFVIIPAAPLTALLFATGVGGGGYLLATKGIEWLVIQGRIAADDSRHGKYPETPTAYTPAKPQEDEEDDDHEWGESDRADREHRSFLRRRDAFRSVVAPFVDICFVLENPDGANKRKDWWEATKGLRDALADDIRRRYTEPDLMINELDWLITWHAERAKERWEKGTLREHRDGLRAQSPDGMAVLGRFALGFGLLCGVIGLFRASLGFGLLLILLVGAGAAIGWAGGFRVQVVKQRINRAEAEWIAAEEAAEKAAFEACQAELADRPSDAEIARWLDHDKFYIKNLAMNTCGLANRDIVAHAILTEYLAPCMKARVVFGPPRYSRYRVIVFLLTEAGVRQISVDLDFLTGTVSNQQRNNFRYDAIASARVLEVGVRFDAGRRSVILMEEADKAKKDKDKKNVESLISSQAFRLSLTGGPPIEIVVEHFDEGFLDRLRENVDSLFELALDNSGVRGALRVLESVAAEGREWLGQERKRRTRRMFDFKRQIDTRRELPWDTGDDSGGGVPAVT